MSTATAIRTAQQEDLLPLLRQAIAALESGDAEGFDKNIDVVIQQREQHLVQGVATLARRLHQAIQNLDLDSRLACIAGRDIPDARSHLDHVVRLTEEAAHRTLDLVEDSRRLIDGMTPDHDALLDRLASRPRDAAQADADEAIVATLDDKLTALRGNLSALAQAQEYQDLSGQMIRRVINLVQAVERALVELLRATGADLKIPVETPIVEGASQLRGPGAPNSASQQDADALLADLGF
jgi:chemotaxis protein CheZ